MISGQKYITQEDILKNTNEGYDIYRYYHGGVPKKCKSPFRRDNHASFGFFYYNGIWLWKDIKENRAGGPIEFVIKMFSLPYQDAINKISSDFGFIDDKIIVKSKIITWDPPKIRTEYSNISFTTIKFDARHHKYWNDYHLSEDYLKKFNVFRIKDLIINNRVIKQKEGELRYVYWVENIDKAKILRIGVSEDNKWRSNVPFNHLWYLNEEKCDKLLICKSNKDALVLSLFGLCITATQSENSSCLSEENISKINNITNNPIIAYGTDKQAKDASLAITSKTKWKHLNMPDKYLEYDCNDFAEVAKDFGLKDVENHLKNKKII